MAKRTTGYVEGRMNKRRLIEFEITQGLRLKQDHPEIGDRYRDNGTLESLARLYNVAGTYGPRTGNTEQAARCIVGFALRGNPFETLGPVYEGAIPCEELNSIQSKRSGERARKLLEKLDPATRRQAAMKALATLNLTPWGTLEREYAVLMSEDAGYKTSRGQVDNARIATELNHEFHQDKQVRTANTVYHMLRQARITKRKEAKETVATA